MRRRVVGIAVALGLAAFGTILLVLYVGSARDEVAAGVQMRNVLVVRNPIEKGTAPTLEDVRMQQVPAGAIAASALVELTSIKGLVATTTLLPGEQLVRERFSLPQVVERGDLPKGFLEVTLPVERDRAVGGKIRPGTKVALLVTFEGDEQHPPETRVLLHKALVTAVQTDADPAITNAGPTPDGQPPAATQAPKGGFLMTLALDVASVERVVFAQETGSLWFAVEPDDAPGTNSNGITRDNVF